MSEDEPVRGRVVSPAGRPRSYVIETPNGQIERNRSQLQVVPNVETESDTVSQQTETETVPETPRRIMIRSRTRTVVSKPDRLTQQV